MKKKIYKFVLVIWRPLNLNFQCRPREVVVFLTTHLENDNRAKFWIIFPDTFHNFQNVLFIVLIVLDLFTRQGIISYFNMFFKLFQLFNLKKIKKGLIHVTVL